MKYVLTAIANVFLFFNITAQTVNSNKSIVWNPYCGDARLSFTFYSKSLMSGILEPTELIIYNRSSHKLLIRVGYTITDICGGSKEFSKSEELNGGAESPSSGAFFSGVDFETSCKEAKTMGENLKTKISGVIVSIKSVEDITAKEEEEKRKQQEEEELKQRKKEEELKKKKEAEEKRIADEKKRMKEEEDKRMAAEEAKTKQEAAEKTKKEFEEKETAAKSIADENERKEAEEKIAEEKKVAEKKAAEKKDNRSEEEKQTEKAETQKRIMAGQALESEGDRLRNSDPAAALEKYQQAQNISYTPRVAEKIKSLQSAFIAKAGVDAVLAVDELANQLDPKGNTRQGEIFSGYDGLSGSYDKLYPKYKQSPYNVTFFGLRMSAIFLAIELRIGYNCSPIYEYEVVSNERGESLILDKVGLQQQSLSTGLSAGLNFKIKSFCFYSLYGAEWMGVETAKKLYSSNTGQYKLKGDNLNFPDFMFRLSSGIDFKIPKTSLGIGIRYNMNNIKTKPEKNFVEISNSASTNSRYTYYVNKIADVNYKFNDFGVRLIWDFD